MSDFPKRTLLRTSGIGLILLGVGLGIATFATLFLAPDLYKASVRFAMEKDKPDAEEFGSACIEDGWASAQVERVQSKLVLCAVITNLDLQRKWAEKFKEPGPLPLPRAYALLRRRTSASIGRGTTLFEVQVRSEDPTEAARIANTIAVTYREQRIARRLAMSESGVKSLEEELAKTEKELKLLEESANRLRTALYISEAEAIATEPPAFDPADARSLFFKARRDMETLKLICERMTMRMWQEKVEVAMHGSTVEIIEAAEPPSRPLPPDYWRGTVFFGSGVLSAILGALFFRRA